MRTNAINYILSSEKRKRIFRMLLEYPERQWSCPAVEGLTKLSHPTVFRTLNGLARYGILKTFKLSRKTIIFELTKNPLAEQINKIIDVERESLLSIARSFFESIFSRNVIFGAVFGSVAKGGSSDTSDIDILLLVKNEDELLTNEILDKAAELSADFGRTISPTIMTGKEFSRLLRRKDRFATEASANMEVLHGKKPS
jgi:predicted nucleotidyltransferase